MTLLNKKNDSIYEKAYNKKRKQYNKKDNVVSIEVKHVYFAKKMLIISAVLIVLCGIFIFSKI